MTTTLTAFIWTGAPCASAGPKRRTSSSMSCNWWWIRWRISLKLSMNAKRRNWRWVPAPLTTHAAPSPCSAGLNQPTRRPSRTFHSQPVEGGMELALTDSAVNPLFRLWPDGLVLLLARSGRRPLERVHIGHEVAEVRPPPRAVLVVPALAQPHQHIPAGAPQPDIQRRNERALSGLLLGTDEMQDFMGHNDGLFQCPAASRRAVFPFFLSAVSNSSRRFTISGCSL